MAQRRNHLASDDLGVDAEVALVTGVRRCALFLATRVVTTAEEDVVHSASRELVFENLVRTAEEHHGSNHPCRRRVVGLARVGIGRRFATNPRRYARWLHIKQGLQTIGLEHHTEVVVVTGGFGVW